jgi:hypothetical protein
MGKINKEKIILSIDKVNGNIVGDYSIYRRYVVTVLQQQFKLFK